MVIHTISPRVPRQTDLCEPEANLATQQIPDQQELHKKTLSQKEEKRKILSGSLQLTSLFPALKIEVCRSLRVGVKPDLEGELQDSQGYTDTLSQKKKKKPQFIFLC